MTTTGNGMTITRKLTLCFGASLVTTIILACSSLWSVSGLGSELETQVTKTSRKLELAGLVGTYTNQMRVGLRGAVMFTALSEPDRAAESTRLYEEAGSKLAATLSELRPMLSRPASVQAADSIRAELASLQPQYRQILQFASEGRLDDALKRLLYETTSAGQRIAETSGQLVRMEHDAESETARTARSAISSSWWIASVLTVLSLGMGGVVVLVIREMSRALKRATEELHGGAAQVAAASAQIASSSQSLAQGASEQAASVQESSAASQQVSAVTRANTERSDVAANLVGESQKSFAETAQALEEAVDAMKNVEAQSGRISKIIKVIDEIAFQTNILALNAAVEAARAGDAGMGFAVVADEVRNLAQRSAEAARDTATMIEESIAKSSLGKSMVDKVAAGLTLVKEKSGELAVLVTQISASGKEQARGVEQINHSLNRVGQVTQDTAASAEEGAAAAEELTSQSRTLQSIVEKLSALVGGGSMTVVAGESNGRRPVSAPRPGGFR